MSTEVLARKYRPKRFEDLVGQNTIAQTLSLALDSDRLAHAYLLSGLRGSGKTSTARIFAKSLVCDEGPTSHPCETCTHCIMANEGRHIDIIEMDAASSRKIDDIRELIEQTKYKPASARFKIFIIDEVHMLTKEAFNALLKTLEEPPSFVKFILATTDPLKLPATILSRTQHFRFKRISDNDISNHLTHILNTENIGFEPIALAIIARAGSGSLRDALTLLDQAIIYSKNFVDVNTVTDMLGLVDPQKIHALFQAIFAKDQTAILNFVKEMTDYESSMVIDELIAFLKDRLFLQDNNKFSTLIIERFFRILSDAKSLIAINADGSFVLTLIFFKMFEALKLKDINEMIASLETDMNAHQSIQTSIKEEPLQPKKQVHTEDIPQEAPKQSSITIGESLFKELSLKLADRNLELGQHFDAAVHFISLNEEKLILEFHAPETILKTLRDHYKKIILPFIADIFGEEIKVVIQSKPWEDTEKKKSEPLEEAISIKNTQAAGLSHYTPNLAKEPQEEAVKLKEELQEDPNGSGSCVVGCSDTVPAEKSPEFDQGAILQDPMVQKAIELFAIEGKAVKIQNKI